MPDASAPRESVIEQRSIDYVPKSERHGVVWHQGPFWFAGNFVLPTFLTGTLGPILGLSVGWSILAIVAGALFGTFFMAFHANQGPRMGLPQMIQSRAQFGRRGVLLPFIATIFVYVGFLVFDVILATQGLQLVLPGGPLIWYPVLIAISIVIAVVGHDLLHLIQRWLTYVLILVFAVITVLAITNFGAPPADAPVGEWNPTAFLVQFSLAAGYNISYAVYVSDYTRYLPATVSAPKLISWVYAGAALSAIWLMSLGSVLSSALPGVDAISTIQQVGDSLFAGFGTFAVLVSVVALISIMGVNAYGAMLTGTSAIDGFRPVRATVRLRIIGLVIVGLVSVMIALLIPADYVSSFNNFVLLMLYFLVPWTAINLVDFYVVRRGHYSIVDIFRPNGIYGVWAWRGMLSYVVGFLAMVPFFAVSFYVGPAAQMLGGADISFAVGLVVAGGLYFLLTRGLDRSAEDAAVAASDRELEGQESGSVSAGESR